MKDVYLDNAATTSVAPEVLEAMLPYLTDFYGNPSSIYSKGRVARRAIDTAREQIAAHFNCEPDEIYFTSGGCEANSMAIRTAEYLNEESTFFVSPIEHHSIDNAIKEVDVELFTLRAPFLSDVADLMAGVSYPVEFVSVMTANNETGTIQPIDAIGALCREHKTIFHTDAVQAVGHMPFDLKAQCIDMLSMSGHKIHAPKGTGFLYIRRGVAPRAVIHGTQERGYRGGTENVAGIVGLGKAVEMLGDANMMREREENLAVKRDYFERKILSTIPHSFVNAGDQKRVGGISNIRFDGIEGDHALLALDVRGVTVSTGSACNSEEKVPSKVLKELGLTDLQANSSLRFSLDHSTTYEDLNYAVEQVAEVVAGLRD